MHAARVTIKKPRNRKPKTKVELVAWPKKQSPGGKARIRAAKARQRPQRRRRRTGNSNASGFGATRTVPRSRKTCVIGEDEYIGPVIVDNQPNFNVTTYQINPGQAATFPWLSREAQMWEKYTFEMLEFYIKREVSEFAPAGQQGKVIMSVDYDASDSPPTSKQMMEDTDPHCDAMPCENQRLRLNRRDLHGSATLAKYVRTGGVPSASDIKTFDVGNLFIATQGIPSNTEVGELRVRYRVRFDIPILESVNAPPINNTVSEFTDFDTTAQAMIYQTFASGTNTPKTWLHTKANGLNFTLGSTPGDLIASSSGNYMVDGTFTVTTTSLYSQEVTMLVYAAGTLVAKHVAAVDYNLTEDDLNYTMMHFSEFVSISVGEDIGVRFIMGSGGSIGGTIRVTSI
jgi:hypothetical protein